MSDVPANIDSDVDVVDVDMDDALSGVGAGVGGGLDVADGRIASMDEMEIFRTVMKKGSLMFSDGRMLTKCPCRSNAAICAMYPMVHNLTNQTMMVCAGPTVEKKEKFRFFSENEVVYESGKAKSSCPYSPSRLNEKPDYIDDSGSGGGGWLE